MPGAKRPRVGGGGGLGLGSLERLPPGVLASVGSYLPQGQLLAMALVSRAAGAAFGAALTDLCLSPAPLREDPRQPTEATWMAFVQRHAASLERLLRRLPRLRSVGGPWSVVYMQAVFGAALLRGDLVLPSVRRLVLVEADDDEEEEDDEELWDGESLLEDDDNEDQDQEEGPQQQPHPQTPSNLEQRRRLQPPKKPPTTTTSSSSRPLRFPFEPRAGVAHDRACLLLAAAAEGRLPGLRVLDLAALGAGRARGGEESGAARRLVERLRAGGAMALPRMTSLAVDAGRVSPGLFFALARSLVKRGAALHRHHHAHAGRVATAPSCVEPRPLPLPLRELRLAGVPVTGWREAEVILNSGLCEELAVLDVSGRSSRPPPYDEEEDEENDDDDDEPAAVTGGGGGWGGWATPPHHHQHHHLHASLLPLPPAAASATARAQRPAPPPTGAGAIVRVPTRACCPHLARGAACLAAWLTRTGAPRLQAFSTDVVAATFTPLAEALADPRVAPGLEELGLSRLQPQGLRELGALLARGGIPRLRSLALYDAALGSTKGGHTTHLEGFLADVLAAGGLPGLEELVLYAPRWRRRRHRDDDDDDDGGRNPPRVFLQGLQAGCFRGLRRLELFLADEDDEEDEEDDDEAAAAAMVAAAEAETFLLELAAALQGGAPCGMTLVEVELSGSGVSPKAVAALRRALPGARIVV